MRTYFNDVKAEIKRDHSKYIAKHPELREILNDFLSTVMLEKPNDVYDYAQQYFAYYNIDQDKILYKPVVISGPSGSGKVCCNIYLSTQLKSRNINSKKLSKTSSLFIFPTY